MASVQVKLNTDHWHRSVQNTTWKHIIQWTCRRADDAHRSRIKPFLTQFAGSGAGHSKKNQLHTDGKLL